MVAEENTSEIIRENWSGKDELGIEREIVFFLLIWTYMTSRIAVWYFI